MASKHNTRSSTNKSDIPTFVSPCLSPKSQSQTQTQKPRNPVSVSGSDFEGPKRRRLIKGKAKMGLHEQEAEIKDDGAHPCTRRILFREIMPHATASELDKLRLTTVERERLNRVARYNIHGGRHYPKVWVTKHLAFKFFKDFLDFQGWDSVCSFTGYVYPVELIQFYATVQLKKGCLIAVVNGRDFSVSINQFCALFSIPNEGIEINPSEEWGSLSDDEKLSVKRYFDGGAGLASTVLTGCFSPKVKFLFNFLWNTVIPRRGGRDKVSSYEMIVVKHWLEGVKVNLGSLVFNRVLQISKMVTEEKDYSTLDLPYGIWLSHLLETKHVVNSSSYGICVKDEMNDTFLKFMKITTYGPDLVFQVKGGSHPLEQSIPNDVKPVSFDCSKLETHMESFMERILTRLDQQESRLCEFMTTMGNEKRNSDAIPLGASNNDAVLAEILDLLKKLDAKFGTLATSADRTMHECIRSTLAVQNLASQGGALWIAGRTMREEMGIVYEAVRALALKILNFDTCLTAQATHIRTCLDRLGTLEYRSRPGYVNPNNIRHHFGDTTHTYN